MVATMMAIMVAIMPVYIPPIPFATGKAGLVLDAPSATALYSELPQKITLLEHVHSVGSLLAAMVAPEEAREFVKKHGAFDGSQASGGTFTFGAGGGSTPAPGGGAASTPTAAGSSSTFTFGGGSAPASTPTAAAGGGFTFGGGAPAPASTPSAWPRPAWPRNRVKAHSDTSCGPDPLRG